MRGQAWKSCRHQLGVVGTCNTPASLFVSTLVLKTFFLRQLASFRVGVPIESSLWLGVKKSHWENNSVANICIPLPQVFQSKVCRVYYCMAEDFGREDSLADC